MTHRGLASASLMAMALLAGGCAGPRAFVNPQADMTLYRQVAFLPFNNLSAERFASDRVARALMTEMIIADRFRIVEAAQTVQVFEDLGVVITDPTRPVFPEKLKEAGARLEVQAFVRGAVTEYQILRMSGQESSVVGFDVEMIDAATSNVVWRVQVSKRGRSRLPLVGGTSTRSLGRLTQEAAREVVDLLRKRAF